MDNVYTKLCRAGLGRINKRNGAFFLDVQKAYDTVWRDGLWLKLWRMWHVIKKMYEASRSTVLLEGEKSAMFSVEQGAAEG